MSSSRRSRHWLVCQPLWVLGGPPSTACPRWEAVRYQRAPRPCWFAAPPPLAARLPPPPLFAAAAAARCVRSPRLLQRPLLCAAQTMDKATELAAKTLGLRREDAALIPNEDGERRPPPPAVVLRTSTLTLA